MGMQDFMPNRRSVMVGGQLFRVGRPTLETVLRFQSLYGEEIEAARKVFPGRDVNLDTALALFVKDRDRFGEVLETCVSGSGHPSTWPLEELAKAILSRCELDRFLEAFRSEPDNGVLYDPGLESVSICRVATFYNVSPMELATWPYEAYFSAIEAADRIMKGDVKEKRWFMGTPTGEPGVSVM